MLEWVDMRKNSLLFMAAMMVFPLHGQGTPSLQQLADSMQVESPAAGDKQLKLPTIPGAEVRFLGCDYEQIITQKGHIRPWSLSDTPVRVSFSVKRGAETVTSRDYEVLVPARRPAAEGGNTKPKVIPEILQWRGGKGNFHLGNTIYCKPGAAYANVAKELAADIKELFGKKMTIVSAHDYIPPSADAPAISLGLWPENRQRSKEDYELHISPELVKIDASTPTGLYWGTRTLLQMLKQGNGTAPCGKAADVPRYPVRAFMLDVGRLPMPLADIKSIIRTMAWYKMNELQLHLNDNYIFHEHYVDAGEDPFKRSYSAFRLESNVRGKDGTPLTAQDLFYSKDEFRELVRYANRHGVNIIPEFDTPGHALSFTRVRPDLIYQGPMSKPKRRCEMLDAANPESLKFAAKVWDEYLKPADGKKAVFADCPVVHVGADEFFGDKEDYRAFANGILRHALKRGYTPRIWGSLHAKPGKTPVVSKGVQMNLWSGGWAKAWASIEQGYDIINTDDGALYIVPYAGYYRMDKNHKWVYENWQLNNIHGQKVPSGHPQLLGAMFAIWQDESDKRHNGYMCYDYWPALSGSIDVLAERMWGQATPPRSFAEHRELVKAIGAAPRADILHRSGAESKALSVTPATLPHKLGKGSLGPNWHLTAELTLNEAPEGREQVLLSSREGQLLAVGKDGSIGFRRADTMEFCFAGAKLSVGERVKLELIGKPGNTQLLLNGQPAGTLTLKTHHGRTENLLSTFILPLETLGESFCGTVHSLNVTPTE